LVTAPVLGSKPSTAGVLPAEAGEAEEEEEELALRVRRFGGRSGHASRRCA